MSVAGWIPCPSERRPRVTSRRWVRISVPISRCRSSVSWSKRPPSRYKDNTDCTCKREDYPTTAKNSALGRVRPIKMLGSTRWQTNSMPSSGTERTSWAHCVSQCSNPTLSFTLRLRLKRKSYRRKNKSNEECIFRSKKSLEGFGDSGVWLG